MNPRVLRSGIVKKAKILFVLISLASFTLFAQEQEGVVAKTYMDLDFTSMKYSLEITHHFNFGDFVLSKTNSEKYVIGMEDQIIEKGIASKAKADSYIFNPDEILYQNIKENSFDILGFGLSGKSFYERAGLQFFWRFVYGGLSFSNQISETSDPIDLLSRQKFVPSGDKNYGNMIAVTAITSAVIPELTLDQVDKLLAVKSDVSSEGYVSLANKYVEEVYDIISTEHNSQGFDFTLTPEEIKEADSLLRGSIAEPTAQEKRIEAERQKIKSWIRWTYTLPETLLVYNFLASTFEYQGRSDVGPSYVVNFARVVAEWKLANPDGRWKEFLQKSVGKVAPSEKAFWPDLYLGLKTNPYPKEEVDFFVFNPDVMVKAGFGLNFGKSFVYATGYVGLPVVAGDIRYEANLNTNIRFIDFFELHTNAYYYEGGRIRGVIKPNFVLLHDFIEIGGGLDIDIQPSISPNVFGEVFIAKRFGVGIIYGFNSGDVGLNATVKF